MHLQHAYPVLILVLSNTPLKYSVLVFMRKFLVLANSIMSVSVSIAEKLKAVIMICIMIFLTYTVLYDLYHGICD